MSPVKAIYLCDYNFASMINFSIRINLLREAVLALIDIACNVGNARHRHHGIAAAVKAPSARRRSTAYAIRAPIRRRGACHRLQMSWHNVKRCALDRAII